ncbi:MAG: hydroxyacid dehydrogenase [Parcubacteria group bacterium]|nr:hydroxyacid dehydrogenase [Parcubacteria group bacterium]
MVKTNVSFLGVEKWEEEYLVEKLKSIKNLSPVFYLKSLDNAVLKKIQNTEILCGFVWSEIDKKVIDRLSKLKFIVTMSTGFDHIDLSACKGRGIKVSNVPFYGENTVAEHTFALILALSRKIYESVERTKQGDFTLDGLQGFDLKGKTIGIIGLGHIGRKVAEIASGFGMQIVASDPKKDLKFANKLKIKYKTLDYLLSNSDIISLHAPYSKETHHLISKKNISRIKKGALLINTARGGLVDAEALIMALDKNILSGAGIDVLEEECFIKEEKELLTKPFQKTCDLRTVLRGHLLTHNKKVLVTPHNAFNSKEALLRILDTTVENIKGYLKNKPVNLIK